MLITPTGPPLFNLSIPHPTTKLCLFESLDTFFTTYGPTSTQKEKHCYTIAINIAPVEDIAIVAPPTNKKFIAEKVARSTLKGMERTPED